jgi:hypothetical protein
MTGYPLEDEGRQMLEQGIVIWLKKPLSADAVDAAIRQSCRRLINLTRPRLTCRVCSHPLAPIGFGTRPLWP